MLLFTSPPSSRLLSSLSSLLLLLLFVVVVDRHRRMTNRRPRHMSILIADLYNENPDDVQIAEQKVAQLFVQQSVLRRGFCYVNRLLKLTCDMGVC